MHDSGPLACGLGVSPLICPGVYEILILAAVVVTHVVVYRTLPRAALPYVPLSRAPHVGHALMPEMRPVGGGSGGVNICSVVGSAGRLEPVSGMQGIVM